MMNPVRIFALLASLAGLAAGPAQARTAEEAAGEMVFHRCKACHSLTPGAAESGTPNTFGPSLIGVVGRKAGTLPGFDYSVAMQRSGLTWTEANLRAWMANNDGFMPGTRMRHVAITDPAEQDYLLAYLKSLK